MSDTHAASLGDVTLPSHVSHDWIETAGGRLSRCSECGLVATTRAPQFEYDASYFTDGAAIGYDFDADHARDFDGARFAAELDRLERRGPRGSLLDIGCATGTYLCAAAARGWNVTGVEVAEFARAQAANRSGAPVVASCDDLANRTFDVVTLHHVLEHIHEPVEFLRQTVAPRIAGRLLVEVPNFGSLPSRINGSCWQDLRLEQHVFHYTPRTLAAVVESAGLRVDRVYSLWEPLWSMRATVEFARLLVQSGLGRNRRWEAATQPAADSTRHAMRRYTRPAGVKRLMARASELACRPAVLALESAGLGGRLVVEAVPGRGPCRDR